MLSPAVTLNVRVTVNVRTAAFNYQKFYIQGVFLTGTPLKILSTKKLI